jgi:hypothetical protein
MKKKFEINSGIIIVKTKKFSQKTWKYVNSYHLTKFHIL